MEINISEKISGWLAPAIHTTVYVSDWYEKRISAIQTIAEADDVDLSIKLLNYYFEKADVTETSKIDSMLQGEDLSFDTSNSFLNRLLVGICLIKILQKRSRASDTIGLTFSTYSLQGYLSKDPETLLAADLALLGQNYLNEEMGRVRSFASGFKNLDEYNKKAVSSATLRKAIEGVDSAASNPPAYHKVFTEIGDFLPKLHTELSEKLNKLIEAFNSEISIQHDQIAVSREETNLLWWLFGEFSREFDRPFFELGFEASILLIGKDSSDLTEILPGHPSAKAFIHRALQSLTARLDAQGLNPSVKLGFAETIETDRNGIEAQWVLADGLSKVLEFCPIHRALKCKLDVGHDSWRKAFEKDSLIKPNMKITALDLGYQLYQERMLIRNASVS